LADAYQARNQALVHRYVELEMRLLGGHTARRRFRYHQMDLESWKMCD
jgi:hypothetical protein